MRKSTTKSSWWLLLLPLVDIRTRNSIRPKKGRLTGRAGGAWREWSGNLRSLPGGGGPKWCGLLKRWCYRACLMSTRQRVVEIIWHLTHSSTLYKVHRLVTVTVECTRGADPAFIATILNEFPKSLGKPSLLTHFPCLWTFLKMAISSKVLRVGCLCVSLPLSVTHAHTCACTHIHTQRGAGGEGCSAWGGAAARVLQAATHGPGSVLGILWAAWDKHYYYNLHLPLITGAVQVPSSGFSFFMCKIIPMDGN